MRGHICSRIYVVLACQRAGGGRGGPQCVAAATPCTQHTSAYVSIRQHTAAYVSMRQYTTAYVIIRQHTSAYVSIRQHTSAYVSMRQYTTAYDSIRQHTSAHVSIRQQTSAYVSKRQHTSAYVSIRQHTSADGSIPGGVAQPLQQQHVAPAAPLYAQTPLLASCQYLYCCTSKAAAAARGSCSTSLCANTSARKLSVSVLLY
jgi:hypothetical protein